MHYYEEKKFETLEAVEQQVKECKDAGHHIAPWDDPATMTVGWLCTTCKMRWVISLLRMDSV